MMCCRCDATASMVAVTAPTSSHPNVATPARATTTSSVVSTGNRVAVRTVAGSAAGAGRCPRR